jgi:subtilisin family serine protease
MPFFYLIVTLLTAAIPASGQSVRTERIDGHDAAAKEVLVKLRPAYAQWLPVLAAQVDSEFIQPLARAGVVRIRSRSWGAAALTEVLRRSAWVEVVEPNYLVRATETIPNDPELGALWGLRNTGQFIDGQAGVPFADIDAVRAWNTTTGSLGIVVAITDTGIDYSHPDLAANVWSAPGVYVISTGSATFTCLPGSRGVNVLASTCDPMDTEVHGTHIAGTIGAEGNNGRGVTGVNWNVSLLGIKFLNENGIGTLADGIAALNAAVQLKQQGVNIRVINASWSITAGSSFLLQAIQEANAADILVVASAGNNGRNNDVIPQFPASYNTPNVISTAATDNRDNLAFFSNYGPASVHLGAPGSGIYSTLTGNRYGVISGTSMATAMVSGAAALVLSRCPLSAVQLKTALLNSVDPVPSLLGRTVSGGRLNIRKALDFCTAPPAEFSLGASATSATLLAGSSTEITLTVSPSGGFAGEVSFLVSGAPPEVTTVLTPPAITGGGTAVLRLTASSSAQRGVYFLAVTATSGSITRTVNLTLNVQVPDFALTADPQSVNIALGSSAATVIQITTEFGFASPVSLSVEGLPAGLTAAFDSSVIPSGGNTNLTLTAAAPLTVGSYSILIRGSGGGLNRTVSIDVFVIQPPDFSMTATPGTVFVGSGGSVQSFIQITPIAGFNGTVNLSVSGLPAGVTASLTPASIFRAGVVTLTLNTTSAVLAGNYSVVVQGVSENLVRSVTITLGIQTQPALITPATLVIEPNGQATLEVRLPAPAPEGGVILSLSNSNSLVAGLNLSTILIPQGQDISTRARVTALGTGESIIRVSADGYQQASTRVQVGGGALAISTTSLPQGQVGTPYAQTLTAMNGVPPYSWSLTAGTLPAGLVWNAASGLISGTPSAPATGLLLTFRVTDSSNPPQSASATLNLNIVMAAQTRTVTAFAGTPQSAPAGTVFPILLAAQVRDASGTAVVGAAVTFTAPASGASGTFAGFGATATAVTNASGIATAPAFTANAITGSYAVTASTPNATAPALFSLTNTGAAALQVPGSLAVDPGGQITLTVTLPAPAPEDGLFVTLINSNPAVAALNVSGFLIPGGQTTSTRVRVTGLAAGAATITLSATGYQSGITQVQVGGSALAIITNTLAPAQVGVAYSQTLTAINGTPPYAWSVAAGTLPAGLQLNSATGQISGIPASPATGVLLTFRVTDSGSPAQTAMAFFTLTITGPGGSPASVIPLSGTPQTTVPSSPFVLPLQVQVRDAGGIPLGGILVTFTAPANGASGVFASTGIRIATAVTNAQGIAVSPVFSANAIAGTYVVNATAPGVQAPAVFHLTNAAGPVITLPASLTLQAGAGEVVLLVTLSAPAPPGGLFLSISSSNPAVATVNLPSMYMAEGQTTTARARVSGWIPGATVIIVSAPGYASGSAQVQVTP